MDDESFLDAAIFDFERPSGGVADLKFFEAAIALGVDSTDVLAGAHAVGFCADLDKGFYGGEKNDFGVVLLSGNDKVPVPHAAVDASDSAHGIATDSVCENPFESGGDREVLALRSGNDSGHCVTKVPGSCPG